jgi:hypothetical protein
MSQERMLDPPGKFPPTAKFGAFTYKSTAVLKDRITH